MNSPLVLRMLKAALKRKNLTYRALGTKLGLTEAAIKKQFQSSDISLNRILEICEILEISFSTLIEAAKSNPIHDLKLTDEQQNYFLKQPDVFFFFLKLSHLKGDTKEANTDFKWSESQMWKVLKSLDDLELIRLHEKSRVELIHGSLFTISRLNAPLRQVAQKLGIKFLEKLGTIEPDQINELKISLLRLSEESAGTLKKEIDQLHRAYLRRSEIDSAFLPEKNLKTCSFMIAAGEFSLF
jgi:transcriptional regulator with XRE-family HTH domain